MRNQLCMRGYDATTSPRTSVLPSAERPSAPLWEYVTTGAPHDPGSSTQFRTEPPFVSTTSSTVFDCGRPAAPTPTATIRVSPSGMATPRPPWDANGIGPSAAAPGAATSAAMKSAPAAAKRRDITDLLRRVSLVRGSVAARSLCGYPQPPRRGVHVQPRLAALPVHGQRPAVQRQGDLAEGALIGRLPWQPDAMRNGSHGVERMDEGIAAGVLVESED